MVLRNRIRSFQKIESSGAGRGLDLRKKDCSIANLTVLTWKSNPVIRLYIRFEFSDE